MNSLDSKNREIPVTFFSVFIFSLLPGLILKRAEIFHTSDPGFYFLHYGIICTFLFIIHIYSRPRTYVYFLILFILFDMMIFKNPRNVFFIAAFWISVYMYRTKFNKIRQSLRFFEFIIFALLLTITHFLIAFLAIATTYFPDNQAVILGITGYGFLIGIGGGIGFETGMMLNKIIPTKSGKTA